jgi:hypothetical protein
MTVFLCTIRNIDQTQTGASGEVRQGKQHGQSITYKITSCWVTLLQQARRAAVLDRPYRLRPSGEENSVADEGKEKVSVDEIEARDYGQRQKDKKKDVRSGRVTERKTNASEQS